MSGSFKKTVAAARRKFLGFRDIVSKYVSQYQQIIMLVIKFIAYKYVLGRIAGLEIYEAGGIVNSQIVQLVLAGICAFLPSHISTLLILLVFFYNLVGASMVGGALFALIIFIVYILTVRFVPEYTYFLLVMPISLAAGHYFFVPMLAGLYLGSIGMVPVMCGTFMWGLIRMASHFLSLNVKIDFKDMSSLAELPGMLVQVLSGGIENFDTATIILIMISLGLVALCVGVVFKLRVNYVHYISLVVGMVVGIIALTFTANEGGLPLTVGQIWGDAIIACIMAAIIKLIVIPLDYQAIQVINFSDDDYFYQVKVTPKANAGISAGKKISEYAKKIKEADKEAKRARKAEKAAASQASKEAREARAASEERAERTHRLQREEIKEKEAAEARPLVSDETRKWQKVDTPEAEKKAEKPAAKKPASEDTEASELF